MARKVAQIRYYGDSEASKGSDSKNQPSTLTSVQLRSGSAFSNYMPLKQIGIQTMPGVEFYLNGSIEPIIIGNTGIYELNVENLTEITSLSFDYKSLKMINDSPSTAYIIVDMLYDLCDRRKLNGILWKYNKYLTNYFLV